MAVEIHLVALERLRELVDVLRQAAHLVLAAHLDTGAVVAGGQPVRRMALEAAR